MEKKINLPTFIIIGAGRCGTSFLYSLLIQHPAIYLKPNKRPEPHFFVKDSEYDKGLEYYSQKYFSGWNNEKQIGEASTSTLFSEKAAKRIKKHIPEIKIICMLREPVERLFSEYYKSVDSGWEKLSLKDAIRQEEARINNPKSSYHRDFEPDAYVKRGFYYKFIESWLKYFPKKNIYVGLFEDMKTDYQDFIKRIYSFLNVDNRFLPEISNTYKNSSTRAFNVNDEEIIYQLKEIYKEPNKKLEELININTKLWL